VGIWGKVDLHTPATSRASAAQGPAQIADARPADALAANASFNGVELHEKCCCRSTTAS